MNESDNNSSEYLVKEVDYLRSTYVELRKETRALETYAILTVGAFCSWYIKDSGVFQNTILLWLPHMISLLFSLRAIGVYMQMCTIRKYLVKLESHLARPKDFGWEQFLNDNWTRGIWPATAIVFWTSLNIITLWLAKSPVFQEISKIAT